MVPEGWILGQVSDVCGFQNGHGFTPPVWDTKGLPIIRIQNLNGSKNFNYFSGKPEPKWLVESGQMLFAWAGTKGASFGPTVWQGETGVLNQHIFKVFAADNVDHTWLYLLLRFVTDRIETKAHGFKATLVHVKKSDIESQPVHIPPLPEQRKIAEILSTWDRAIEKTEALLVTAQDQKRALMQALLTGKRRFIEFEGEEWREVRLGDVADIAMGSSPKSSAYNSDKVGSPLIQGNADIRNGRSVPRVYTSEITTVCAPNDILLSVRAPVGTIAISDHDACVGRGAAVIKPKHHTSWKWLKHVMLDLEPRWRRVSQGSTFDAVNSKDIKNISIMMPPTKAEQSAVGVMLEIAENECDDYVQFIQKLRIEKKALMQQLLTGKRRVVA